VLGRIAGSHIDVKATIIEPDSWLGTQALSHGRRVLLRLANGEAPIFHLTLNQDIERRF
jgi:hypothetical protein